MGTKVFTWHHVYSRMLVGSGLQDPRLLPRLRIHIQLDYICTCLTSGNPKPVKLANSPSESMWVMSWTMTISTRGHILVGQLTNSVKEVELSPSSSWLSEGIFLIVKLSIILIWKHPSIYAPPARCLLLCHTDMLHWTEFEGNLVFFKFFSHFGFLANLLLISWL